MAIRTFRNIPACFTARPIRWRRINGALLLPPESEQLDYEGEIALVIGRAGRRIAHADALDHVAGVTLVQRRHHPRLD